MLFKSRLREHLAKKGIGVRELSRRSGVSTDSLYRAMDDLTVDTCTLKMLGKVADVLGLPVRDLYEEVTSGEPQG